MSAPNPKKVKVSSVRTLAHLAVRGLDHANWYQRAREVIDGFCEGNGWYHDVFIDLLAITSPRVSVKHNFTLACRAYKLWHEASFTTALDILASNEWDNVLPTTRTALINYMTYGTIKGRKTRAFAQALHGAPNALVLDVWMARALGVDQSVLFRKDVYAKSHKRITRVSELLDLTIAQTQACIWAGTCLSHGRKPGQFEFPVEIDGDSEGESNYDQD